MDKGKVVAIRGLSHSKMDKGKFNVVVGLSNMKKGRKAPKQAWVPTTSTPKPKENKPKEDEKLKRLSRKKNLVNTSSPF
jgi:hypothetical protein